MHSANRYLDQVYMPRHNAEFAVALEQEGSAFVLMVGINGLLPPPLCRYRATRGQFICYKTGHFYLLATL